MRQGGGKSKGASFEREICKALSLWLSQNKQEDLLWRSAMSGGRATVARAKGKQLASQSGDISSIHPLGHAFINTFYVECKNYKDLNFVGLISKRGKLYEFWQETQAQAKSYQKQPILIAKQNQQPIIVCLTVTGINTLSLKGRSSFISHGMYAVRFDDFIKWANRVALGIHHAA